MKKLNTLNKTTRVALQRFLELLIPAVLLSVLYSLLLQYGIIKTVLPGGKRSILMYYTPMLFAMIYTAGNAILMRQSRKLFITLSGFHSETAEKGKAVEYYQKNSMLNDDPKGYYIANYSALAVFAILPFISRYAFDSVVFRWVFGITNWVRLAVAGLGFQHLNNVMVPVSISVFILILAAMIPLAQINVRKNYIKDMEKKQKEREERLSTATRITQEHRETETTGKAVNIYDSENFEKITDNREGLDAEERRKMEEASKRLREKGRTEKLDIYSMAADSNRELSDEEKAKEEESRRLREKGRTEKLDIYSMAADSNRELSDEEKAKEEESRRLREQGKKGPQRVDIYNMKKE